jgi:hypothetical protein
MPWTPSFRASAVLAAVCAVGAGGGGGSGDMVITWPKSGAIVPPSFSVRADIIVPNHKEFIAVRHDGWTWSPGLESMYGACLAGQ